MKIQIEDTLKSVNVTEQKPSFSKIVRYFNNLSDHRDSEIIFFAKKANEYFASFCWVNVNKWKIDCPTELNKLHKQRYVTKDECLYFLKRVYENKELKPSDNFYDVPIKHFNLDEIIEFKKEDEMMLRGQDPFEAKNEVIVEEKKADSSIKKERKRTVKPKGRLGLEGVPRNTPKKSSQKSTTVKPTTSFDFDFGTKEKVEKTPTQKSVVKSKKAIQKPVKSVAKNQGKKVIKKQSKTSKVVPKKSTKPAATTPKKQQATKNRKGKEILELGAEKSKTITKKPKTTTKSRKSSKKPTTVKNKSSEENNGLLQL